MHDGDPPRHRPGGSAASGPRGPGAGGAAGDRHSPEWQAPDLQALARDWITLWQSELAAVATDREFQESWQTLAALWAGVAGAMLRGLPRGLSDGAAGPFGAGTFAASRPAPAASAPDARAAEVDRLARRVAELERRLAELDGSASSDGAAGTQD